MANKKITKRGVAKILRDAAKLFDRFEWGTGGLGGEPTGSFCAVGAISQAAGLVNQSGGLIYPFHNTPAMAACYAAVKYGAGRSATWASADKNLYNWNDGLPPNSKSTVQKAFRKSAAALEHGEML